MYCGSSFIVESIVRIEYYAWKFFTDESQGAMLELSCRISLRMYVGYFFELDRSLTGNRCLIISTEEKTVIVVGEYSCQFLYFTCICDNSPDLIWYGSKCFEDSGFCEDIELFSLSEGYSHHEERCYLCCESFCRGDSYLFSCVSKYPRICLFSNGRTGDIDDTESHNTTMFRFTECCESVCCFT